MRNEIEQYKHNIELIKDELGEEIRRIEMRSFDNNMKGVNKVMTGMYIGSQMLYDSLSLRLQYINDGGHIHVPDDMRYNPEKYGLEPDEEVV
jgi:hypothetical protein